MKTSAYLYAYPALLALLAGCASHEPPVIALDEPVEAQRLPEPPTPIEVVALPKPLALPAQLKPLPDPQAGKPVQEPADERVRVSRANREARVAPSREGYINAIQVWPYSEGALYQLYTSPGRVTAINLQPGEELVTVAAGDTVRWIVGDTTSGSDEALRTSVLVKPTRVDLKTNLVITTTRRTYLLELTSTEQSWMASVSWDYPKDRMLALQRRASAAQAAAPVDAGLALEPFWLRPPPADGLPTLHSSYRAFYRLRKKHLRPIDHGMGEVRIHASVKRRWEADPDYRPANLHAYLDRHGWPAQLA